MKSDDPEFQDFATKVANDVAEDIDCRETRAQLREVIRFYSMLSGKNYAKWQHADEEVALCCLVIRLLLPHAKLCRTSSANFARSLAKEVLKKHPN